MTVPNQDRRHQTPGNDVTVGFGFTFSVKAPSDVLVVLTNAAGVETVQVLASHYTVTLISAGEGGGTVTMVTPPATGELLSTILDPMLTQAHDFSSGQTTPPEDFEDALDRAVLNDKRTRDLAERSIRASDGQIVTTNLLLPAPLASGYWRWKSDVSGVEFVLDTSSAEDFLQSGAGAVTRTVTAKLSEIVSITDFGASTALADNTFAINAAKGSGASMIYVPEGDFSSTSLNSLTMGEDDIVFFGPGRLEDATPLFRAKHIINMESAPSAWASGIGLVGAFEHDMKSPYHAQVYVTGAGTIGQPTAGYFQQPQVSPFFVAAFTQSGHNESPYSNDGRTGWPVCSVNLEHHGKGDAGAFNASVGVWQTDPNVIGFHGHPAGFILNGQVSARAELVNCNPVEYNLRDNAFHSINKGLIINFHRNAPKPILWAQGQTITIGDYRWFANATAHAFLYKATSAGTTGASPPIHVTDTPVSDGGVLWDYVDLWPQDHFWTGQRMQSFGLYSPEVAYQVVSGTTNGWKVGFDLTTTEIIDAAVALKAGQEFHYDAEAATTRPCEEWGDTIVYSLNDYVYNATLNQVYKATDVSNPDGGTIPVRTSAGTETSGGPVWTWQSEHAFISYASIFPGTKTYLDSADNTLKTNVKGTEVLALSTAGITNFITHDGDILTHDGDPVFA